MSFASAARTFAAQAARERRECWPATVLVSTGETLSVAKSPTKQSRVPQEQGVGYVQRAIAVFGFPVDARFTPTLGAEFTVLTCPEEIDKNTAWRCYEVQLETQTQQHHAACFRLDS